MPLLSLLPEPIQSYEDSNGRPLNGGKLFTYAAGTTTPKATYQDAAGAIPNTNPIILNERGECTVYGSGAYRFVLQNAFGATIWDRDNITAFSSEIQDPNSLSAGDALVAVKQPVTGGVARTQHDKNAENISAFDLGAKGDGTTDDSATFGTSAVSTLFVPASGNTYRVSTDTTVTTDLIFTGGQITIDSGKTLTINGNITAPSKVIFKGLGTVIINRGEIDVAWFDGTDASTKWDFCKRGIQNTNGLGKIVVFSKPAATDAWATTFKISGDDVWGPRWKVDAPIILTSKQQATVIRTPAGFVATSTIASVFQIGEATDALKVDYCHFPDKLSIEGNDGKATYAVICYGSSHMRVPYQEIYRCAGWLMQPKMNKQCSDIKFDFIDTGGLWGPVLTLDGSNGANNTITDLVVDFINSTGFATGHAPNALVQMNSNYNNITIGRVVHRAVVAGAVDATGSVVSLTNVGATAPAGNYYPCRYGIRIGPIINGSSSITAKAFAFSDQSSGVAAKFKGVTIEAGSLVDGGALANDIDIDFSDGIVVQGLTQGRKLNIGSTAANTQVYGIDVGDIIDAGVNTLINGKSKKLIAAVTPTATPMTYVNNNKYDVDFQVQGATSITAATYTRNGVSVSVTAGGTSGSWRVSPGDNIAINFTGTISAANVIPR